MKIYLKSEDQYIIATGFGTDQFLVANGVVSKTSEDVSELEEYQSDIGVMGKIGEAMNNAENIVTDKTALSLLYSLVQATIS